MRIYAIYLIVAGLAVYAWRDWFKSLCGLLLMMAFMEYQDMPKSTMGIQGLNPWNALMSVIILAWLASRRREKLTWDMPSHLSAMLLLCLAVILVGFFRAVSDMGHYEGCSLGEFVSDRLVNSLKWVLVGLLLYDGCRSRSRLKMAICSIIVLYFLLAVQVAMRIGPSSVFEGGPDIQHDRLEGCAYLGYSTVEMSAMLAGGAWALLATGCVFPRWWQKGFLLVGSGFVFYGMLLTGGRGGYLAWAVTGLTLCAARWRRYLLLAPILPFVLYVAFPAAADRALIGVDVGDDDGFSLADPYAASGVIGNISAGGRNVARDYYLSSGRTLVWPYVVDKILESPLLGHGRQAMRRTGLTYSLGRQFGGGEAFSHPHNAYLEWLLDNGIAGFVPVMVFFGFAVAYAMRLFVNRHDPLNVAVGGVALSLLLAQLVSAATGQTLYPNEVTFGMWATVFLLLRVYEGSRVHASSPVSFAACSVVRCPLGRGPGVPDRVPGGPRASRDSGQMLPGPAVTALPDDRSGLPP